MGPKLIEATHLLAARPTNGDDRDRTDDLRLAKAALSQLSYIPNGIKRPGLRNYGANAAVAG